ncbi:MAG: ABC transporter permease [Spirochaetaceae bacterium]|nr:ABC transporter permease [Spirochaetaceae bacterium]MBQ8561446.1 ABC transporter permease [Spirochaetaceae bacterium]MBR2462802.1 ABC transporter permease [Spirochaetaceae bacterium]
MDVIARAFQLMQDRQDFFLELLGEHLRISFTAICIAMVVGLIIGILVSEFSFISKPTIAVVNLLYTIPSISLLGFLIPFSGIGDTTAIIALTIYALLPMVRNTYTGMTTVSPQLLDAATAMGSTRIQVLLRVRLPLALPVIVAGIRSMTVMTIALSGISSFIGAGGLGVAVYRGITTNNKAMTLAGSLLIALLAVVADFFIGMVERAVKKHRS